MKKKKISKLAKLLHNESRKILQPECKMSEPAVQSCINMCDYDEQTSNNFYEFVLSISTLNEFINFDINDLYISINGDISRVNNKTSNKEDYLNIKIDKQGFSIQRSYNVYLSFKDEYIFDKIKPMLIKRYKESSKDNLFTIIDDVIVKTNLSRGKNLDELLKN